MSKVTCDICSICYNEELLLPAWIESWLSVPFVNKINLVDSGSTDRTFEIAKSYDRVNIIKVPWKNSFARQRNVAIKLCKSGWIFQPDIDELPCGDLNFELFDGAFNEIIIPYVKFYTWDKLWFFNRNVPTIRGDIVVYAVNKSTTTLFRKEHLVGYDKDLHEMPVFKQERKSTIGSRHKKDALPLTELSSDFFMGHYDQAKHFEQAKQSGTSVFYEMGIKRTRYRQISDAIYNGKIYNKKWANEALRKLKNGNSEMVEELGKAQLDSFLEEHFILEGYDATNLNNSIVKNRFSL